MLRIIIAIVLGLIIGGAIVSSGSGQPGAQAMTGTGHYIAAGIAILIGLYLFSKNNSLANFMAFLLIATGATIFLGPLVAPNPYQPQPPAMPPS
ncbi:MAG TPA: hypothetical protein VGB59_10650 [Allosphingosinicella sp.]|jgi:heme A synthase